MFFGQFNKKLSEITNSVGIKSQLRCYNTTIEETIDGNILINGEKSKLNSLEEARQYIKKQEEAKKLQEEAKTDSYEELSDEKIATIIQEYYDIKVTDTLIESYKELASSKLFTTDSVVTEIRKLNKLDKIVEGKIDYKLSDGCIIAINESTQQKINTLFNDHKDIVEYMRESKENFLSVIKKIGE